ncbi:SDR family NAD(P)-dependent oxidoreductase [Achromobacter denitrificans]|uniref:SDR family NAD(P)-dependent oxidoreductase n=1 Tax=Achromobacter denitrificans TaxID=32002 RepID=UPI0023E8BDF1|nr:SDR family oxidoreductase [Achromobacter denitrificans]MDF3847240.1 SDR family NAD(P)-dependent oxidoreductase [Achromobacter denitrificans]
MSAARRYLVAGGASGIGLAFARLAASQGAAVAILDRDAAALGESGRELRLAAALSVTSQASAAVEQAVREAAGALGGIDGVVNCAGVDLRADLESTRDEDWNRVLAVNLSGPMHVCRAAVPHLKQAGGGSIVNVSSAAGLSPLPQRSAYCAAKAGVNMFGKVLAMELAAFGIRVATVCPGAVDTPLFRSSYEDGPDPQAGLAAIRARYALGRIARPEELAEAILFLSGPGASYITGATLAVDGGRSFH